MSGSTLYAGGEFTTIGGQLRPYLATFAFSPAAVYLPLIFRNAASGPDLVVESLSVTSSGVTLVIRNSGAAPVSEDFWVDVHFNPSQTPRLNQPWDSIASHGAVWGVSGVSLNPGQSLSLTSGDAYYFPSESSPLPFPIGAQVYALVDSINYATGYGSILEGEESNNLFGPVVSTAGSGGPVVVITGRPSQASMKTHLQYLCFIGGAMLALTILAWAILPAPTVQAGTGLPPQATPTPTHTEKKEHTRENRAGAYIELQTAPIAASWGVVQWQDSAGGWHAVEGWQGTLPASSRWWVHPKDFGTGPFRWAVFDAPGGGMLAASRPFQLPNAANQLLPVALAP